MSGGFVYVASNDAMPGLCKIGMTTTHPELRVAALSAATGVPVPFSLLFYAEVQAAQMYERHVHRLLDRVRVSQSREFFRVSVDEVRDLFERLFDAGAITEVMFAPAAYVERYETERAAKVEHFIGQSHEPIRWNYGF